jgi:hypothetical protein
MVPRMDAGDFSYQVSKDEKVFIAWRGRRVVTLRGRQAARFRHQIAGMDRAGAQLLMARITGNFKRGNERLTREQRGGR